jgi:beta-lactamase class A
MRAHALLSLALLLGAAAPLTAQHVQAADAVATGASDPGLQRLEHRIQELAKAARGVVGVGIIHLETGREVYLNPKEVFSTGSTRKLPIAVELMMQVNEGKLRLDSMVSLQPHQIHPASGLIPVRLTAPGISLSLYNYLRLMIEVSDGTATSAIIRAIGGPEVVTERMRRLGFPSIVIGRETDRMMADFEGLDTLPAPGPHYRERFYEMVERVPAERREQAHEAFYRDPWEKTTPYDMARLLARVWRGELMSRQNTETLLQVMYNLSGGEARLKGLLPLGTPVAHKTGSIGKTTNDVGIIDLPDGAGHVLVAVYIKLSDVPESPDRERVIAEIARSAYDYFTFNNAAGGAVKATARPASPNDG